MPTHPFSTAGRPAWLTLDMDGVPAELRRQGWVGWRGELGDDGKWKKPPRQIGFPAELASNSKPEHWRNEGDVREVLALAPELFDGFGVVLTATANITFIDLDDVRDPNTGAIEPWAIRMVNVFDSWTEISVSGEGLHIFVHGRLPGDGLVNYLDGDPSKRSRSTTARDSRISRATLSSRCVRSLNASDS